MSEGGHNGPVTSYRIEITDRNGQKNSCPLLFERESSLKHGTDTPNDKCKEKRQTEFTGLCLVSIYFANPVRCDRGATIYAHRFLSQTISENKTNI